MFPKPLPEAKEPKRLRRARRPINWKRIEAKAAGTVSEWQLAQIYEDQGGLCAYDCTAAGNTVDHVVPIAKGGTHEASNIVLACLKHNLEKGTLTWVPKLRHRFLPKEAE